jgi:hypothetical protein
VHLGLQIGLNFVPAPKTETRLRQNDGAAGRDFCRMARLSFFCRLKCAESLPRRISGLVL